MSIVKPRPAVAYHFFNEEAIRAGRINVDDANARMVEELSEKYGLPLK